MLIFEKMVLFFKFYFLIFISLAGLCKTLGIDVAETEKTDTGFFAFRVIVTFFSQEDNRERGNQRNKWNGKIKR